MVVNLMFAVILTMLIVGMFVSVVDDFCLGVSIIGISSILGAILLKEVLYG